MTLIVIRTELGTLSGQLDTTTGLDILRAGSGFGVHAGEPYFAPAGATLGDEVVLSVSPVTGGPVLTAHGITMGLERPRGSVSSRAPARQAAVHEPPSGVTPRAPTADRTDPRDRRPGTASCHNRPRPYAGPARHPVTKGTN